MEDQSTSDKKGDEVVAGSRPGNNDQGATVASEPQSPVTARTAVTPPQTPNNTQKKLKKKKKSSGSSPRSPRTVTKVNAQRLSEPETTAGTRQTPPTAVAVATADAAASSPSGQQTKRQVGSNAVEPGAVAGSSPSSPLQKVHAVGQDAATGSTLTKKKKKHAKQHGKKDHAAHGGSTDPANIKEGWNSGRSSGRDNMPTAQVANSQSEMIQERRLDYETQQSRPGLVADPGSSASLPIPGAFAMDLPAPVYVMGDDDDEEPIPEELLAPYRQQSLYNPPVGDVEQPPASQDETGDEEILDAEVQAVKEFDDKVEGDSGICSGKRPWVIIAAVTTLIAVIVVVSVLVASGGGSADSDTIPTLSPSSLAPTQDESNGNTVGPWDYCYSTTRSFMNSLMGRTEFTEFIDVEICPRANVRVDDVDRTHPTQGLFPPLAVQSNMRIKCGEEGRLTDQCIVWGGSTLLVSYRTLSLEPAARNVTVEGITFERGIQSLAELTNGGDVTFRNCLFRQSSDRTPIWIDFRGDIRDPSMRQTVTFENCIFEDLDYGPNEVRVAGDFTMSTTIVMATHSSNTVIFKDCVFRDNTIQEQAPGAVITSYGAEIQVEQTCFLSNQAGRNGSPILLGQGNGVATFTNGLDNYVEGLWDCALVGNVQSDSNITCTSEAPDSDVCKASKYSSNVFW